MSAYACGSGGAMFIPETIEKTTPKTVIRYSNDNGTNKSVDQKDDREK